MLIMCTQFLLDCTSKRFRWIKKRGFTFFYFFWFRFSFRLWKHRKIVCDWISSQHIKNILRSRRESSLNRFDLLPLLLPSAVCIEYSVRCGVWTLMCVCAFACEVINFEFLFIFVSLFLFVSSFRFQIDVNISFSVIHGCQHIKVS